MLQRLPVPANHFIETFDRSGQPIVYLAGWFSSSHGVEIRQYVRAGSAYAGGSDEARPFKHRFEAVQACHQHIKFTRADELRVRDEVRSIERLENEAALRARHACGISDHEAMSRVIRGDAAVDAELRGEK